MVFTKSDLDIWGLSETETLAHQDDELFLGDNTYLEMMLTALDENKYLESKKNIVLEALCIILYDSIKELNSVSSETRKVGLQENLDQLTDEYVKRKAFFKTAENKISDYLKEIVFPQIGIDYRP